MLPLVTRTGRALSRWLGPAWEEGLSLRPDLDQVSALSPEREALWARVDKATFLSRAEKREAVGYGAASERAGDDAGDDADAEPEPAGESHMAAATPLQGAGRRGIAKFNPHHDELGRFTFAPEGGEDSEDASDGEGEDSDGEPRVIPVSRRRTGSNATPAQEAQLATVTVLARAMTRRTRELDPNWQPPQSVTTLDSIAGQIAHQHSVAVAAEARLAEITRDAIPSTNPSWGVNRLRKELGDLGYVYSGPTTRSPGSYFANSATGEQARIMDRPPRQRSTDPPEKFFTERYYRYRTGMDQEWGAPVPIPNKP